MYYIVKWWSGSRLYFDSLRDGLRKGKSVAVLDTDDMVLEWVDRSALGGIQESLKAFPRVDSVCLSDRVQYVITRNVQVSLVVDGKEYLFYPGKWKNQNTLYCNRHEVLQVQDLEYVNGIGLLSVSSSGNGVFRVDLMVWQMMRSRMVVIWIDTVSRVVLGYCASATPNIKTGFDTGQFVRMPRLKPDAMARLGKLEVNMARTELLGSRRIW